MIQFEHIQYLNLLYAIPLLILIIILFNIWKKNSLRRFGDIKLFKKLTPDSSNHRNHAKNSLKILTFITLIFAIANPQIGSKIEEIKREGVDLIIAIDISTSMLSEDIKPNRLERAKMSISKLIDRLDGDKIGLIVFAGDAHLQLPITTDYSAAHLLLSTIDTDMISQQGTEISEAIDLGIQSFDLDNNQDKAMIIITDGENHDEKAIKSTKSAAEKGIFVHTLGMGLDQGVAIPIRNKKGKLTGHKKDKKDKTVISKLNEKTLIEIASAGNGTYVRANNTQVGLTKLLKKIDEMEKQEISILKVTEYEDRFQWLLGLSLLLLLVDLVLLNKKKKWFFGKI